MKGVIWGLAVGCAIGYIVRKLQEEGKFECVGEYADKYYTMSKNELKNVVDAAKGKAEELKERIGKSVKGE
ncbi:hypothetical protein SAMN05444405_104121 [Bacteroides luti]|uniref:YtxH-like protein n=1 Tax=Bacteroides luti TaxID=1297750 RepID=A0A1M4XSY7_9BACE|nr:hypothetical protein [Bacteroides luti]SHE96591.1 hypothetical protein SAMN05444405_104121 [Bacteroides luti]